MEESMIAFLRRLMSTRHEQLGIEMEGYFVGPVQTQILRIIVPLVISIITTWIIIIPLVWLLSILIIAIFGDVITADEDVSLWPIYILINIGLLVYLWQEDESPAIEVPINTIQPMKFFGGLLNLFLLTGKYPWFLKKLWIELNTDPIPNSPREQEKIGRIDISRQTFPVWNDKTTKSTVISVSTLNNSEVFLIVTLEFMVFIPYTWIKSDDPRYAIGEEVRSFIREVIPTILDTDVPLLKTILTDLFENTEYLLAFTLKGDKNYPKHKLVTNRQGKILAWKIEDSTIENTLLFKKLLEEEGDEDLLKLAKGHNDKYNIARIKSERNVANLLKELGAHLFKISVSDVKLSKEVLDAAKKAASEMLQRSGHITSAETTKMVSKELQEAGFKPEDAAAVAAVMDGVPIDVVRISGEINRDSISALGALLHNALTKGK